MSSDEVSFETISLSNEEAEHSIEMQLPYIAKIMEGYIFTNKFGYLFFLVVYLIVIKLYQFWLVH